MYFIKCQDYYISLDNNNRPTKVNNIRIAIGFDSKVKAYNYRKNLPKIYINSTIEEIDCEVECIKGKKIYKIKNLEKCTTYEHNDNKLYDNLMEGNNMCLATNYLTELEDNINNIKRLIIRYDQEKLDLFNKIHECDYKIGDLRHALEFRKELKLSGSMLMKINIKMSEISEERREFKEELERLEKMKEMMAKLDLTFKDISISHETKTTIIKTIELQKHAKYSPRTNVCTELGIDFDKRNSNR